MKCWKCSHDLDQDQAKIGFRAICDHCGSWLHVCKNCKYYQPGRRNDCLIPDTDYIADREAANYCEEFTVKLPSSAEKRVTLDDVKRKLFGEGDA
jgi:hypothetical protein